MTRRTLIASILGAFAAPVVALAAKAQKEAERRAVFQVLWNSQNPGYTFTESDVTTLRKLNLIGKPQVSFCSDEIVTIPLK